VIHCGTWWWMWWPWLGLDLSFWIFCNWFH